MESQEKVRVAERVSLPAATGIGLVSLTVAHLDAQIQFYQDFLGFKLHWKKDGSAGLGAGKADLLVLTEVEGAKRYSRSTGLYHFAVLFPNQKELAKAIGRLFAKRYPNSPTDHIMTKTTYLRDPEGQEIELYAESPEDGFMGMVNGEYGARRADGSLSDGREPLDLEALFAHLQSTDKLDEPLPEATKIGHVHLYIRDVAEALKFYTQVLGFDEMGYAERYQMAFVSAGGYHHHVGLNSWIGKGAPPPPPNSQGLRHFVVQIPGQDALSVALDRIKAAGVPLEETEGGWLVADPSQNKILLTLKE